MQLWANLDLCDTTKPHSVVVDNSSGRKTTRAVWRKQRLRKNASQCTPGATHNLPMTMFDTNPNLIQDGSRSPAGRNVAPLVLIHDGGGTIFSYYLLDNLDRRVWGIANPRFRTRIPWSGGLHEMAVVYAEFVTRAISSGPIILGGWSLGGLLALEMAHVLTQSYSDISVLGLILIDSVCPIPPTHGRSSVEVRLVERRIEWPSTTAPATKASVEACFREAHRMVHEWVPPTSSPPLAVLIRSQDPVRTPGDGLLYVDLYRDDRHLGWDAYRTGMFFQVLDIPGHHYNVFALDHVGAVTDMIKAACRTIESSV